MSVTVCRSLEVTGGNRRSQTVNIGHRRTLEVRDGHEGHGRSLEMSGKVIGGQESSLEVTDCYCRSRMVS